MRRPEPLSVDWNSGESLLSDCSYIGTTLRVVKSTADRESCPKLACPLTVQ